MDSKRALRWSGYYFLVTVVFGLVGAALVGIALWMGGLDAYRTWQATGQMVPAVTGAAVWLLLAALGVAVWRFGKAWAMYWTLTGAVEEDLSETYDNEKVKSDILSVLDDRLSDMQQDIQSMNRNIRTLQAEEENEYEL